MFATLAAICSLAAVAYGNDKQPCTADEVAKAFSAQLLKGLQTIEKEHVNERTQHEMAAWALEGLFDAVKEPMPQDLAADVAKLPNASAEKIADIISKARRHLHDRKELAGERAFQVAIAAIVRKLEPGAPDRPPQSWYIPVDDGFVTEEAKLVGVGLVLELDPASGLLRVRTPTLGGPAYTAGIRAGDILIAIRIELDANGAPRRNPVEHSTKGMTVERAIQLLQGDAGSKVKLIVRQS